ncbi:MAG: carbamate kinase [Micrococcales bacterium]|nr:carbamate kinase [Micrococcales bacterium]
MRIVIALGGNALLRRGEAPEAELQRRHVEDAVAALAPIAADHEVVITHGNGPQVGVLAAESIANSSLAQPYPLDVIGAQTQGMIGYWIVQALVNALPDRPVTAVLNQTLVDVDDPALTTPTKPVGEVVDETTARRLEERHGWTMRPDGSGWRRAVGSPTPLAIVESSIIDTLLAAGVIVVCAGGGGVPVVETPAGLRGVEAVVDKDAVAALLAVHLRADALLLLTDVAGVMIGFGTPEARVLTALPLADAESAELPAGSMGPKVRAAAAYVRATGGYAAIGDLERVGAVLAGDEGTRIVRQG